MPLTAMPRGLTRGVLGRIVLMWPVTLCLVHAAWAPVQAQATGPYTDLAVTAPAEGGPIRLRSASTEPEKATRTATEAGTAPPPPQPAYVPGEFEVFVRLAAGRAVRRLGAELVLPTSDGRAADLGATVPPDYLLAPGDEVLLLLWG